MHGERLWRPDFGDSQPDGQSLVEVWDCKALSRQRVVTLFKECEQKYRAYTGSRSFHLALFDPTQRAVGDLVVSTGERYAELLAKEELADGILGAMTEFDPPNK